MKKAALIILDGWGIGDGGDADGIARANTPNYDHYVNTYPVSTLKTYGQFVGLPEGQMGNSEVGHLNIGAGRVVYQDLARINGAIEKGELQHNRAFIEALSHAETHGVKLHLMGLLSRGGVHSSQDHLHALIDIAERSKCTRICIHAFTDGRDTNPKSGIENIRELETFTHNKRAELATVIGRYYAMDRDNRWERISVAYHLLTQGRGEGVMNFGEGVQKQYADGTSDEFLKPMVHAQRDGRIEEGDVVVCFNFRTDRCRQITEALTQQDLIEHGMRSLNLHYTTMTRYDESFKGVNVMYDKDNLKNTLGEVIAAAKGTQLRIAETEKYPHVTFFFSGGREDKFENEMRIMVNSPKVATYDLQPEMSADEVTEKCIQCIKEQGPDFICLNFANPDMVGHTGILPAIIKAVERVDQRMNDVIDVARKHGYEIMVIADHGNADQCKMPDGTPHTAHTMNPVPCIYIGKEKRVSDGILADVAPTILKLMEIPQPPEMTGKSLIQ